MDIFWTQEPDGSRDSFGDSAILGPKGPGDSSKGRAGSLPSQIPRNYSGCPENKKAASGRSDQNSDSYRHRSSLPHVKPCSCFQLAYQKATNKNAMRKTFSGVLDLICSRENSRVFLRTVSNATLGDATLVF